MGAWNGYLRCLGLDLRHEDVLRVGELVLVERVVLDSGAVPSHDNQHRNVQAMRRKEAMNLQPEGARRALDIQASAIVN